MKILTVANQKGGVGKSTNLTQFAYYLRSLGYRVLVSDFDHQGHTSKPIIKSEKAYLSVSGYDLLSTKFQELSLKKHNFVLSPSSPKLVFLEREKHLHNDYIQHLQEFLTYYKNEFDICLIDTNPNPDIRVIAALSVATHVLCPIQLNQESIDGLKDFFKHPNYGLHNIKQKLNKQLKFVGALPSMVQGNPFQKDNLAQIKRDLKSLLIPVAGDDMDYAYIPQSVAFAEAQQAGLFIGDIKKSSARKAWHITKQSFNAISQSIGLEV